MSVPRKNWLEWSVFTAGLLLLICTTSYLSYEALVQGSKPAALSVTLGEPWSPDTDPSSTVIPVTVRNDGGHTAVDVTVEIILASDTHATEQAGPANPAEPAERRQLVFAFVPRHSSRTGALIFHQRPSRESLRAHVLGYLEP